MHCFVCAVSWATWLLFTYVHARCVVLRVRCPGPLGSRLPGYSLRALCCVCVVLGHLAPVHRCALSVRFVPCAVSWATWLLFTNVSARCVVLRVRCPGPLGSCSPVCSLGASCCVCDVLGHLAPVHRCSRSACCVALAVSCTTWLLFIGVLARRVVLRVRCPGPLGSCSPVCFLGALCCVCGVLGHVAPAHPYSRSAGCVACAVSWATWPRSPLCALGALCPVCSVLGHLAPVHRCVRSVRCVASAVSWATRLPCTGVHARHVVLHVPCPGPLGICSPCACSLRFVACAVPWATWLLFTGVHARRVVLRVPCRGPLGSCSPMCTPGALCCVCGVLGHFVPIHWCAPSVRCVVCAVSWATRLLCTVVHARCVVFRVWCPGPLGSCSPVCSLRALCCVCGVLGHLAPVHRCSDSASCVAFAVSWATWLLSTGVLAWRVALRVPCPGHLAPVHPCARSVRCVLYAVSWATWLLFTGVHARRVVLRVHCLGPLGSSSLLCSLGVLRCACGVLGHLAPVHRCARSACCVS